MTSTIAREKRTELASFAVAEPRAPREVSFFGCLGTVVLAGNLSCNV